MYGNPFADFIALNKLRGFSPRQQRLLELEAVYHSTQYAGLPPWEQEMAFDGQAVRPLCGHEREPRLKAGLIEEKVETLIDMLVGEGRFPTIGLKDKDLGKQIDAVRMGKRIRGPARDLVVKGSGALEIGLLDGNRIEAKHLRPEWCEPIFVSKAGRPRALQLVEELAALDVTLPASRSESEHLWTPEGAASDELCFLRYEYVYHEEEAARDGASGNVTWRHRVDFTPTLTVYYYDVQVYEDTTSAVVWRVSSVLQHGWGVVPVAWARTPDAEDGEPDGPSLITEALRSICEAADRMLTRKDASVSVVSNPKAYTIDLEDLVANVNADKGMPTGWRASSGEVLTFQSGGEGKAQIGLLEPTGKGPEVAKAHFDDLVSQAARVSRVLAHDPQQAAAVQSGVALQRMMEPTLQRLGTYRVAVGELIEAFVTKAAAVLGRAVPVVEVQWPPAIRLTPTDLQATAQALSTASGGAALISQETAVRLFATAAEIEDPDAEVALVAADADEAMQRAKDALASRPPSSPPSGEPDPAVP